MAMEGLLLEAEETTEEFEGDLLSMPP
jgi:hypothetical protein